MDRCKVIKMKISWIARIRLFLNKWKAKTTARLEYLDKKAKDE